MAAMEPLRMSIHCHLHKKEGVVAREWMCHMGLMIDMTKNKKQQKRAATSCICLHHRPYKIPTIATKAQKQNQHSR